MKKIIFILTLIILVSCEKEDQVTFNDLVIKIYPFDCSPEDDCLEYYITEGDFIADNNSSFKVSLIFDPKAEVSDISAKATLSNLNFEDSSENELTLTPEVELNNLIKTEFIVKSTTKADSATIELNINQYRRRYTFNVDKSIASGINISKSASSASVNFVGEVTFEGFLFNSQNNKVSQGTKVSFTDLLSDGSPANGEFRSEQLISNSESKVSAIYSPGLITPGQFITIIAEVLDEDNNPTGILSSTNIYAN